MASGIESLKLFISGIGLQFEDAANFDSYSLFFHVVASIIKLKMETRSREWE